MIIGSHDLSMTVTPVVVQLNELTSRLEELETDQKDQEGYRVRLKKENKGLKQRFILTCTCSHVEST